MNGRNDTPDRRAAMSDYEIHVLRTLDGLQSSVHGLRLSVSEYSGEAKRLAALAEVAIKALEARASALEAEQKSQAEAIERIERERIADKSSARAFILAISACWTAVGTAIGLAISAFKAIKTGGVP